jgi:CDP-diglyceride synthetase
MQLNPSKRAIEAIRPTRTSPLGRVSPGVTCVFFFVGFVFFGFQCVVIPSLFGIRQQFIRSRDFHKTPRCIFIAFILVRMMLKGKSMISFLDVSICTILLQLQYLTSKFQNNVKVHQKRSI